MASNHQGAELCPLCERINVSRKLFPERYTQVSEEDLSGEDFFEFGTLDIIRARTRASTCGLCQFVAGKILEYEERFSHYLGTSELFDYALTWERYGSLDTINFPHATRFRLNISLGDTSKRRTVIAHVPNMLQPSLWPVPSLELQLENPTWSDTDSRGGRLRPLTCEPRLLRSWLRTCEEKHSRCVSDNKAVLPELRFIDIKLRCVSKVHAHDNENLRYIALSYVWGKNAQRLTLTRANCSHLGEIGSLQPDNLSQTIADAIKVVEMLGERYLWVDAFSIVQDDENELAAHLPPMGHIYDRAVLTIVAGSSVDANSGLPGVQQSRSAQHIMGPVGGGALITCCTPRTKTQYHRFSPHHYLNGSEWNRRGWTLQEKVFSRRCLYFMEEQIYWECKMDSWCEESCFENHPLYSAAEKRCSWKEDPLEMASSPFFDGIGTGTGMITPEERHYFKQLVRDYSRRSLSFDEDAEGAIAGLLQTLSENTGAQFWYGLPIPMFDACIWWRVTGEAVQRSIITWPSWSWLAWKGEVVLSGISGRSTFDMCQIQCYRLCLSRTGQRVLERVSDRSISPEVSRPVYQSDIPTAVWPTLQPDFHILFWAQTCVFDVQDGDEFASHVFHVPVDPTKETIGKRSVGFIYRNGHGSFPSVGEHLFTLLLTDEPLSETATQTRYHSTYLLSWHDGIAKREWSARIPVDEWGKYAAPEMKLIIMG